LKFPAFFLPWLRARREALHGFLREAGHRLALCALAALLLIVLQMVISGTPRGKDAAVLLYVSRLSCAAAVLVGFPLCVSLALERLLGRFRWLLVVLVIAGTYLFARDAAEQLSQGDGVQALGMTRDRVALGVTCVLCTAAGCVWLLQAARLPLVLHVLLAGVGLTGLLWLDRTFSRTYGMLAPFVLISTLALGTSLLEALWRARRVERRRTLYGSLGLIAVAAAVSMLLPGQTDRARAAVLSDETSIYALDAIVYRSDIESVQFDLERALAAPCTRAQPEPPWPSVSLSREQRKNVILISVDALRRDYVSRMEKGRPLTPNIDQFFRESRVAKHAYTPYPATLFALGGAFTGLLPSEILLAPKRPDTLLRRAKHKHLSVDAVLPSSAWFRQPAFLRYVADGATRVTAHDASRQVDIAIKKLEGLRQRQQRHLFWIHLLEPHAPYQDHAGFSFGKTPRERYASEIAYLDQQLARLFDLLRHGGWYEDSLILFFADHGQALGERAYFGHHVYLNGFISNVPLALHVPSHDTRPIGGTVSIVDVAPTALHYLDLPGGPGTTGESLLAGDPKDDRLLLSEAFPIRGVSLFRIANQPLRTVEALATRIRRIQEGDRNYQPKVSLLRYPYRLIVRRTTGSHELFDVARDPQELHDVAADHPDVVRELKAELAAWHADRAHTFFCAVERVEKRAKKPGPRATSDAAGPLLDPGKPIKRMVRKRASKEPPAP
jgi:arylsulfatase A-like enzyme